MRRRDFLAAGAAGLMATQTASARPAPAAAGRIKQSACKWTYKDLTVEELAVAAKRIGLHSVELLGPEDWPTLHKHGLVCAMANNPAGSIAKGWNRLENHEFLVPAFLEMIPQVAAAGFPNLICFSGNREGMDDEQGLANCAIGLRKIVPTAEKHGVTICMELLNSKVNHPDYMCDNTPWGVALTKVMDSERFKLLYDIYHMQIMEGDVIRTIQEYHPYIAHYHTGGVPGRHEIDETQELFYPAVMRAIAETGYTGYVGQEFIPTRDPIASLAQAYEICNV